ncbi:MAG: hypothetical protein ACPGYT_11065, partial [Nitrospirales bacterium]
MTRIFISLLLILCLTLIGNVWISTSSLAQDALLEASRPDFQKIPIWVMQFSSGDAAGSSSLNIQKQVVPVLKADLTRSQI